MHGCEALQSCHTTEHTGDTLVARRRVGIVRMTGEPYLGSFGRRDDGREERVDPFPVVVFADLAGDACGTDAPDQLADLLDLALALRILAKQYIRVVLFLERAR